MQVSWIDPGEMAALLGSLSAQPPSLPANPKPESTNPGPDAATEWDGWLKEFAHTTTEDCENVHHHTSLSGDETEDFLEAPLPENPHTAPAEAQIVAIRERLGEIRRQAISAGLMQSTDSEEIIALPPPVTQAHLREVQQPAGLECGPEAGLGERLAAFGAWASAQLEPDAQLLLVDEHGDLLYGPPLAASLILSTLMAMNSARRNSAGHFSRHSNLMTKAWGSAQQLSLIPCFTRLGCIQIAIVQTAKLEEKTAASFEHALAGLIATA